MISYYLRFYILQHFNIHETMLLYYKLKLVIRYQNAEITQAPNKTISSSSDPVQLLQDYKDGPK